jgi:hypothetical protein
MTFSDSWYRLIDELDDLPEGATLITPLSHKRFRIDDVQEQQVAMGFLDCGLMRSLLTPLCGDRYMGKIL